MRDRCGLERVLLERRQPVVARPDLDHARADAAARHVHREPVGDRLHALPAQRVVGQVVRVTMDAGRGDDVQAGRLGDRPQGAGVAAEPDRRPVDEGGRAGGRERPCLLDRPLDVGELLLRLDRRREEEMVVRVGWPQLSRRDVAADGTHDPHPPKRCRGRALALAGHVRLSFIARRSTKGGEV